MKLTKISPLLLLLISPFILGGCGTKTSTKNPAFSDDDSQPVPTIVSKTSYVDTLANAKINITKTHKVNQDFTVKYKTYSPDGEGAVEFKAKSIKEVTTAGKKTPEEGKKLILVEIAIRGNSKNKGEPSTFNQIGNHPSPQFVLIDKAGNKSIVEETYYSDGYTEDENLFELSKITLDNEQWVNTAIVFQVDKNFKPDLALRFTNPKGDIEFYDISE